MRSYDDLSGRKLGKWTAVSISNEKKYGQLTAYNCVCDCGTSRVVGGTFLRCGHSKSCGCESLKNSTIKNTRHGLWKHPIHSVWRTMKQRCYNPKAFGYENYGGRGIVVCDRWRDSFAAFAEDMLPTYKPGLTIDRTDVNGPYSPSNCVWATNEEQMNNRRVNAFVEYAGKRQTVAQWAREIGIVEQVLRKRLFRSGWTPEKALTTPVKGVPLKPIAV